MNPVALAGIFGFLKGMAAGGPAVRRHNHLGAYLMGPILEETAFRAPQMHPALSSAAFAAVHLSPGMLRKDPEFSAYRFAEVFAGGLIYDAAFKRYGLMGAVGTHCLHNIACTLGALCSPRRLRR